MRVVNRVMQFRTEQKQKHQDGTPLGEVVTVNITKLKAGVTHDGGKTYSLNVIPTEAECGIALIICISA